MLPPRKERCSPNSQVLECVEGGRGRALYQQEGHGAVIQVGSSGLTFSYTQNEDHFDIKYQECLVI